MPEKNWGIRSGKIKSIFFLITIVLISHLSVLPSYSGEVKPVSVEFRFLCEGASPNCDRMIDSDSKEEMFLQKEVQFSIADLKRATAEVQWESVHPTTSGQEKSLMGAPPQS